MWLPPSSAEPAHRGSNSTHNERGTERNECTILINTPMFKCVLTLVVESILVGSTGVWMCVVLCVVLCVCCVLHLQSVASFVHVEECSSMAGKELQ